MYWLVGLVWEVLNAWCLVCHWSICVLVSYCNICKCLFEFASFSSRSCEWFVLCSWSQGANFVCKSELFWNVSALCHNSSYVTTLRCVCFHIIWLCSALKLCWVRFYEGTMVVTKPISPCGSIELNAYIVRLLCGLSQCGLLDQPSWVTRVCLGSRPQCSLVDRLSIGSMWHSAAIGVVFSIR